MNKWQTFILCLGSYVDQVGAYEVRNVLAAYGLESLQIKWCKYYNLFKL